MKFVMTLVDFVLIVTVFVIVTLVERLVGDIAD
jgi:hypothetical protein